MATPQVNTFSVVRSSQPLLTFDCIFRIWRNLLHTDSHLIFDCSFENEMSPIELVSLAKQLRLSLSINRLHSTPFFFHLTSLQPNGRLHKLLLKMIPTLHSPTFPIHVTEQFIPDQIARERLVYLSPDSPTLLKEFNDRDVYIIGGLVDKGAKKPLTYAKAKELGIRTARLPLEQFLQWKQSNKSLTIDQMTKIVLEFKKSRDMRQAVQHVPSRKVVRD